MLDLTIAASILMYIYEGVDNFRPFTMARLVDE